MSNATKNERMESVIKGGNKFKYNFNWRTSCTSIKDIILSNGSHPVTSVEHSQLMEDTILPIIKDWHEASRDIFKDFVYNDVRTLKNDIQEYINEPEKVISELDAKLLLHLYLKLIEGMFIPSSEITDTLELEVKTQDDGSLRVVPKSKKELGEYINLIIISLNDFFESVLRGNLLVISENEDDYLDNLINLYTIIICSIEKKSFDFISDVKLNGKKIFYSNLVNEDGSFMTRKIECQKQEETKQETEIKEEKSSEEDELKKYHNPLLRKMIAEQLKKKGGENKQDLDVDLSNLSTTNSRKEVVTEFESKNNDSEQLPNLERI